jgi:hypothetical protein
MYEPCVITSEEYRGATGSTPFSRCPLLTPLNEIEVSGFNSSPRADIAV